MFRISEQDIEASLKAKLEIEELEITDLKGGNHWEIIIKSPNFNDLSRIKQHKLIYDILSEPLADESIHALVIKSSGTN
jgi:stress-induced morphogen